VDNELEGTWKEVVVAQFELLSHAFPLGSRETAETLSESIRSRGRYLKPQPPPYEIRMLPKFGSVGLINLHSQQAFSCSPVEIVHSYVFNNTVSVSRHVRRMRWEDG
jgi:hypothetical protein